MVNSRQMNLYDAMAQAKRDAREGELPVVIHKKNYCADLVTMEFSEWIKLYREWEVSTNGGYVEYENVQG